MASDTLDIPSDVVDAAVRWAVRIEFGEPDSATLASFNMWMQSDARHREAWQRIASLGDDFSRVPGALAKDTLGRQQQLRLNRRSALKLLGATGAAAFAFLMVPNTPVWQRSMADRVTLVGQRQRMLLASSARVDLNTDTAVGLPLGEQGRVLRLRRGEIHLDAQGAAANDGARAFTVQTPLGWVRGDGARLVARLLDGGLRIDLLSGQATLDTRHGSSALSVGNPVLVSDADVRPLPAPDYAIDGWIDGVLSAREMPLSGLLDELSRYTRGWLRCSPGIAGRRVTGTLHIDRIDEALAHLASSQGLAISRRMGLWTTLEEK